MPSISQYDFQSLVAIARGARQAFLAAGLDESRAEAFAGKQRAWDMARDADGVPQGTEEEIAAKATPIKFDAAISDGSAAAPEDIAYLADACLTMLSDVGSQFNGAFDIAERLAGRADLSGRLRVIQQATGVR